MSGYRIDVKEIPKWIKSLSETTDNLLTQKENFDSVFLQKYIEKVNVAIKNLNLLGENLSNYLARSRHGNWKKISSYKLEELGLSDNKIETYSSESISVLLTAKSNLQKLSKQVSSEGRKENIKACKKATESINEIIEEIEKIETLSKTENKQATETKKTEEPKQQVSQDNGQKKFSAEKMEAIKIVSQNGLALANLSPEMRNDLDVINAAFKQNPKSLEYVSKDTVLEILAKNNYNKNLFYYVSPLLKQDKDFIMEVVPKNPELVYQCKTIVSSDTLAMGNYVTAGHHLEETTNKLNLMNEKVYKSFSQLARNVYLREIKEQLIKKGVDANKLENIPKEIIVEIEKKLNQIQQIIDKERVTQIKKLNNELFGESTPVNESVQKDKNENTLTPKTETPQAVETTEEKNIKTENTQKTVKENKQELEIEQTEELVTENKQHITKEPIKVKVKKIIQENTEKSENTATEQTKESVDKKQPIKVQVKKITKEPILEKLDSDKSKISENVPNNLEQNIQNKSDIEENSTTKQVEQEAIVNENQPLRKKFDVNNENEMNQLLDFYAQMNVAYYNKKDRTAEEVKLRRRINAQFKRIIDKKASALIENENSVESNFEQKFQEINNGTMFAADDIDEIAKNNGATIKLFQIMSSGVYEKDGIRTRLSQKQRCALATVLQKVSERKLDIENAKLSENGKTVKNNAASTKLNENEKGE